MVTSAKLKAAGCYEPATCVGHDGTKTWTKHRAHEGSKRIQTLRKFSHLELRKSERLTQI